MKNCDRRRQSVLNMLRKTKKLTVEEAMQAFGVSESTVRRLFAQLEAEGEVIRAYGGICFTGRSDGARSYMFDLVQLENADEKNAIGKAAMQLIRNGDIIYLDSGTTVMSLGAAMARCSAMRLPWARLPKRQRRQGCFPHVQCSLTRSSISISSRNT